MLQRPRGTEDVLPPESQHWLYVEMKAREVAHRFGFQEIRTPVFEHTELFQRGAGATSDVVEKEMYTFLDRGGRSLTLRPESTAPVVRALGEAGLLGQRQKVYYLQSHFRYERPQAGRYRQHHQFGVEFLGDGAPSADLEVILLAHSYLTLLGLTGLTVRLNSIGDAACRPRYRSALVSFLKDRQEALCPDCQRRLVTNPLRVLDCKVPGCIAARQGHPVTLDYLCDDCAQHFAAVQSLLAALQIPFVLDPTIVRGLDYYTRTVFELVGEEGQAICGGGRYDGLAEAIGGEATPAVGFGLGLERLLALLREQRLLPEPAPAVDLFLAVQGEAWLPALQVAATVRQAGFALDYDGSGRSLKAQLRTAARLRAPYALILGPEEIRRGTVTIRRMADGWQTTVEQRSLIDMLRQEVGV